MTCPIGGQVEKNEGEKEVISPQIGIIRRGALGTYVNSVTEVGKLSVTIKCMGTLRLAMAWMSME
jgi:hypothetical protein